LRVLIDGVYLMRGGAQAMNGDKFEFDHTQNIIRLMMFYFSLKPFLFLLQLPIQAKSEFLEEIGGFGLAVKQHHAILLFF